MTLAVWGPAELYEPTLDDLARDTAELIRRETREAERQRMLPDLRKTFGYANYRNPCYVGDYSVDEFCSERTGEVAWNHMRADCRCCGRRVAPFQGRSVVMLDADMRWVGLDYREPYEDWFFACGWCGTPMLFTTHWPQ